VRAMAVQRKSHDAAIPAGRFVLRRPVAADAAGLAAVLGDVRVATGTRDIPHPYPDGASEAFLARALAPDARSLVWVMDGSASGLPELLGMVELDPLGERQSEVSYWVAPEYWNLGIASDAVRALVAENPFGDRTLFAEVFQDNPGSARVLTNAGFQYIGDAETVSVARGARVPTWTYLRKLG
jgi:RimJ/RimL family protein N-acetyltransferase